MDRWYRYSHRIAYPLLCLLLLAGGCSSQPGDPAPGSPSRPQAPTQSDAQVIMQERVDKDQSFKKGSDSPIPEEDKLRFQGLDYFDYDSKLRYEVKLQRYPAPKSLRMGTNTGELRDALRYGYFEFDVDGDTHRLQVYRVENSLTSRGPHLFIPFRDATSGTETYGAGRYIDLQENTTGTYVLDFNRAYNPWCVYGKNYSCPVPPAENTLPVAIRAGEKNYPLAQEQ